MKRIISIVGVTSLLLGGPVFSIKVPSNNTTHFANNLVETQNNVNTSVINLSRVKINEFSTDLSTLENKEFTREDYLEEIKWAMIDSNPNQEELLFNIWDSVINDEPENWTISGLDWEVPQKGNVTSVRVKLKPENNFFYTGYLSFKTSFVNEYKSVIDLTNIIKENFIGTLPDNNVMTIKNKIVEKNNIDLMWNQITLDSITESSATLVALNNSTIYKGAIKVEFKIGENLNLAIKTSNLGKIEGKINEDIIIRKLKDLNPKISVDQLKVTDINLNNGTAIINPIDDMGDYIGQRIVSFINTKSLSSVVTNRYLGQITNPTPADLISKLLELNKGVSRDDFSIIQSSLTYSEFIIKATEKSNYLGEVNISFAGIINAGLSYDSGIARVDAYATTKSSEKNGSLKFIPGLGKEAFLRSFKFINFDTTLHAWMSDKNPKIGELLNYEKVRFNKSLASTNTEHDFYLVKYVNVNWMTCHSTSKYYWVGNQLTIEISTSAVAFASGWNAYWARAESQTIINSVWFS